MKLRKNQTGDTIVEVLMAIVVVSVVLGAAYLSANQSLTSTRQSQERGEALQVAKEQVERLKSTATGPPPATITSAFCIDSNSAYQTNTGMGLNSMTNLSLDNLSGYNAACIAQPRYHIGIEYFSAPDNYYKVHVRWDRVNGGGNDEVTVNYKVD